MDKNGESGIEYPGTGAKEVTPIGAKKSTETVKATAELTRWQTGAKEFQALREFAEARVSDTAITSPSIATWLHGFSQGLGLGELKMSREGEAAKVPHFRINLVEVVQRVIGEIEIATNGAQQEIEKLRAENEALRVQAEGTEFLEEALKELPGISDASDLEDVLDANDLEWETDLSKGKVTHAIFFDTDESGDEEE